MNETLIVGAINILLVIVSGIFLKITDKHSDAKSSVIKAFRRIYIEFGNIAAAADNTGLEIGGIPDFNIQGVESAAREIQRLHFKSIFDIIKLNRIGWILKRAMCAIIIMAILAIISNILGNFVFEATNKIRTAFRFIIPSILVFCEVVFVMWLANTGNYLKKVLNTYNNSEF